MAKVKEPRRYPPIYEKVIPFTLWAIGGMILLLLIATIAVALQLLG